MVKTNSWRYITLESEKDSFSKMATEEAIMEEVRSKKSPPTLRFYSWNKPAVSLGFFQDAKEELDLSECKKDNIEIFRRITGGGAVYKSDSYELNYSFIIREDEKLIPKDVEKSYRLICGALIEALRNLGYDAKFKPINDIVISTKKVSGNAQTRIDNVLLHHGTILLKPEVDKMFKYLKVKKEKLKERNLDNPGDLVTGLWDIKNVSKSDLQLEIVKAFEKVFNREFELSALSPNEINLSKKLYSKYSSDEFNFWR